MPKHALALPTHEQNGSTSIHDQIQIALAIADETILKSLLIDCTPPITQSHRIGTITSTIGIPIKLNKSVDGIIQFEAIDCVLIDAPVELDPQIRESSDSSFFRHPSSSLVRCESEMHTLGKGTPLAQAISLLVHCGFGSRQVEEILNLPYDAWHKSWWYALDAEGNFTIPFLRFIRTRHYTDGTFTIQYKDYYSQDKPPCFRSHEQKVLIEIKSEAQSFSKTIDKINYFRERFGITHALLICDTLSHLEAQGFISQGISIYAANELFLPTPSNCTICVSRECPMSGRQDSPVMTCRRFCLEDS